MRRGRSRSARPEQLRDSENGSVSRQGSPSRLESWAFPGRRPRDSQASPPERPVPLPYAVHEQPARRQRASARRKVIRAAMIATAAMLATKVPACESGSRMGMATVCSETRPRPRLLTCFVTGRYGIPNRSKINASTSVASAMRSERDASNPWPALALVRSRIGSSEAFALWSRAVILRDCNGSTRGSFAPVKNRIAG